MRVRTLVKFNIILQLQYSTQIYVFIASVPKALLSFRESLSY